MRRDMILLFECNEDHMDVNTLPALLIIYEEHAQAILKEMAMKHPRPKATTITMALSDGGFARKPRFLPLQPHLREEFSTPDHITALIDSAGKTLTVKLTYEYSDMGVSSYQNFYGNPVTAKDLKGGLATDDEMVEWLINDCSDIAYVKNALGEELFAEMLSKMNIEEKELEEMREA